MAEVTLPGEKTIAEERPQTAPAKSPSAIRIDIPPLRQAQEEQLDRIRKQAELEEAQREQIERIRKEAALQQQEDARSGVNAVFADILDIPGDLSAVLINGLLDPTLPFSKESNGAFIGKKLQDGLNKVYQQFGLDPLTAEETGLDKGIPTGGITKLFEQPIFPDIGDAITGKGFNLTPLITPAEPELGNIGTQERSPIFNIARTATESAVFTILTPALRLLKEVPKFGPLKTRAKVRRFLKQVGDLTTSQPGLKVPTKVTPFTVPKGGFPVQPVDKQALKAAAVETWAGLALGKGMEVAKEAYPGSTVAEVVIGTAFASSGSLLPMRFLWSQAKNAHTAGIAKWGGAGARKRAQTVLLKETDDVKKAIQELESQGLTEAGEPKFVPGFFEKMTPALKTGDEGTINLFTAFLREAEKIDMSNSKLHQELSDIIMATMREPVSDIQLTQEVVEKSVQAIRQLILRRLEMQQNRLAERIATSKSPITQEEAQRMALESIIKEQEIAEQTVDRIWQNVDLNLTASTAVARNTLSSILKRIGAEEGSGLLKIVDEGEKKGLSDFIGKLKTTKATQDPITGKIGPDFVEFVPGTWGKEISLLQAQNLRSRVLRTIRKERVELVPNERKIALLSEVEESLLQVLGSLERSKIGPLEENALIYRHALQLTREVKTRFGPGTEVGNIIRIRRGGNIKSELTAIDSIFAGAGASKGAKGDETIKRILASLQGSRDLPLGGTALEMRDAMEQLVRIRFMKTAFSGGVFNKNAAQRFVENHAMQLRNFSDLKGDLLDVIKTGERTAMSELALKALHRNVNDEKMYLSTIYAEKGPNTTFTSLQKEMPERALKAKIRRLIKDTLREPTGRAREGLNGAFFIWMLEKATIKPSDLHQTSLISGLELNRLWETKAVQIMAKELFKDKDFKFMKQLLESSKRLDMGVLAHAAKGGSFNLKPNVFIEKGLLSLALKYSPTGEGKGRLQRASLFSSAVRAKFNEYFRDPAHGMLYDSFMTKDDALLKALFTDIITEEQRAFVQTQINAWIPTALFNIGERTMNEDTE